MSVHQRLGSLTVQQPDVSASLSESGSPQGPPTGPESGVSGLIVTADGHETEAGDAAVAGGSGRSSQSGQPELVDMDHEHDDSFLEIGAVAQAPICAHYQPGLSSERDTISARPSGSRLRTALGLTRPSTQPSRLAWEDMRPDGFEEMDEVDRYERDYASDDDCLLF